MTEKRFNSWLAGLIEGDGSIIVPKSRSTKNRKNYPRIQIAFHIKDKPLAEKLILIIGGGIFKISGNTVRIMWNRKADILKVIDKINGYMRTPKILRLHSLVDWYNEEDNTNIEKKGIDISPIGENAWLSGMSDADSNFNIIVTKRRNFYRVQRQWRLEISQKTHYGGDQQIWAAQVSEYIKSNLLSRHRNMDLTMDKSGPGKTYSTYMIIAHNQDSIKIMEEYFEKYTLYSSKLLDYKDWKICGTVKENIERVKRIKEGMNSQRSHFDWDHLNQL